MPTHFLDAISGPVLFLALLVLFVVMVEFGYKLGVNKHRRRGNHDHLVFNAIQRKGLVRGEKSWKTGASEIAR